jgi:hypothetical protein
MSRGPGRIERAIEAAFVARPGDYFTVAALTIIAYPGLNEPQKKHRVLIIRAADKVAARLWWKGEASERLGGQIVYYNLLDVRSYTLGKLQASFLHNDLSDIALEALIEPPGEENRYYGSSSRWEWMQPGGAWWMHVEINRARKAGDDVEADRLTGVLNAGIARKRAGLSIGSQAASSVEGAARA